MRHDESLAENRLRSKRQTVRTGIGHCSPMKKTREVRAQLAGLQAVFLKRVQQEMVSQGLVNQDGEPNGNALARRHGAPPQTTINDTLRGADPRLGTVQKFANALEVPAMSLLTEATANLHRLPTYPQIGSAPAHNSREKSRDRKKSRG